MGRHTQAADRAVEARLRGARRGDGARPGPPRRRRRRPEPRVLPAGAGDRRRRRQARVGDDDAARPRGRSSGSPTTRSTSASRSPSSSPGSSASSRTHRIRTPTLRSDPSGNMGRRALMLCAAIDIGSNTTRVLVAEPVDGQLKKVMEQRAYTRINKAVDGERRDHGGEDRRGRRARRDPGAAGARARRGEIRAVATAAVREASNGAEVARGDLRGGRGRGRDPQRRGGGPALLHRRDQDPRPPGRRARSASSTSAAARPR